MLHPDIYSREAGHISVLCNAENCEKHELRGWEEHISEARANAYMSATSWRRLDSSLSGLVLVPNFPYHNHLCMYSVRDMAKTVNSKRVTVLVDMDCFYVQVEQRRDPSLRNQPCAVLQYQKGRSVIKCTMDTA